MHKERCKYYSLVYRRKTGGRHDKNLQIFESYYTDEGSISVVDSVRNNWLKLQQRRLRLDIRKNFLKTVKCQDRLPKESYVILVYIVRDC